MKRRFATTISFLLLLALLALPAGNGIFPAVNAESYSSQGRETRAGDLDGDNVVTSADARIALRASVRLDHLDDTLQKAADVDGDGAVTSADARIILRVSVRLETLPASRGMENVKVGFICLHDENVAYDLNFINGARAACRQMGIPEEHCMIRTNVPEGMECYFTAIELANAGCSVIFADSFGHEDFMIEAAKAYPDVQFCHISGTKAHMEGLRNFHNAYAAVYEGWYLCGVAAGMKLNGMIGNGTIGRQQAKIGFVAPFTYAEVISAYSAFYLGARSVCGSAEMEVAFVGAWYDESAEREAAYGLIANGCALIAQYSDSMGAPTACEAMGVPNIAFNSSNQAACPNTFLLSSRIDWAPCFVSAVTAAAGGEAMAVDWTGTLATGSVVLSPLNGRVAAAGTQERIDDARAQLINGTLHVFDVYTFTKDGRRITSYLADVDTDPGYEGDTEAIIDGVFQESVFRSAPYFDLLIDGVTLLNTAF